MRHPTRNTAVSAALSMAIAVALAGPSSASITRSAQPFVGVTHHQFIQQLGDTTNPYAREVVVNIFEVDRTAAGVSFLMQPGNGANPGEVSRMTTRAFVNSANAQMGVNTGFYDTAPPYPAPHTDLTFIAASNGDVYAPAQGGEATFNVSATNVPRIGNAGAAGSTTFANGGALYNATGGNQRILNGGNISAPDDSYTNTLNPHTAMGISQDLNRLFFVTIDGRQNDYSEGMFTTELAAIMKLFGAWDAINVDGGGSTTMVMDDTNNGVQNARVINSPSDSSTPQAAGVERSVGGSFAIFATPLAGYVPLPAITRPGAGVPLPVIAAPTILENFDGTKGRFNSAVNASGSSQHIAATSASAIDTAVKHTGSSSLRVDIVNTNVTPERMQLRFLSGGGTAGNNTVNGAAMGPHGSVGVFLRLDPAAADLFVSILLDDGLASSNGTERGTFFKIIADGQFHLYQWDLSNADVWANFNAGNGDILGPNAFIDALYFSSAADTVGGANFSGSVWIDTVAYNPNGNLNYLVPEPATMLAAMAGLMSLVCRRRA